MRKVPIVIAVIVTLVIGVSLFVMTRGNEQSVDEEGLSVVATVYPVQFMASYIAGDAFDVELIVPAGNEPHEFEPSFQDVIAMEEADMLLLHGGGFDPWAEDIAKGRGSASTFFAFNELPAEGVIEGDPHFWLDPVLYGELIDPMADALVALAPESSEEMYSRAEELKGELGRIHDGYMALSYSSCYKEFVVLHDAFGYLAARYPAIVLHPVSGISHEEEPSLARLAELADFIQERRIGVIFTEPLVDPAFVQTLSEETGARVEVLDPIEGLVDTASNATYLTQMEYNLQQLRSAIVCE